MAHRDQAPKPDPDTDHSAASASGAGHRSEILSSSETAATPEATMRNAADHTARATQSGVPVGGLNPETVIIQPPAPPPEPPSGRADEQSVTRAELAAQLQVSERTVDRWVTEGVLPAPVRQGRGRMATRFPADAALLYWQEQGEEARKERRHRQRSRKSLPQDALTRESQSRRRDSKK